MFYSYQSYQDDFEQRRIFQGVDVDNGDVMKEQVEDDGGSSENEQWIIICQKRLDDLIRKISLSNTT